MASTIKSTADLRERLIKTIEDVRSGTLDPKQARTIAALSTTVLQSAKLDLDYMRFAASSDDAAAINGNRSLLLTSGNTQMQPEATVAAA